MGIEAWFGTLEDCVDAAVTGRWHGRAAMISLHGRTVVPGYAEGEALVSPEPISGWGGIDPAAGRIIESRHELNGVGFTGKVLVFPVRQGVVRLVRVLPEHTPARHRADRHDHHPDQHQVGARRRGHRVPAVTDLDRDPCQVIRTGDWVRVDATHGLVEVKPAAERS